ncbi:ABC transporter [Erysipelothrix larvae]|uniref:ABC transporter n=1 Tax=Erysipelothrix larvae TaxID=1514105 RepID=A0A0X8H243_9FIRM|nr:ABC transporter ATP-binding protein [Erysipelothrix larvae]AMC94549.1 ABC transporter [Erysipelothrix larvae]
MIKLYNVSKSFDQKHILEDINWEVKEGHIVGLVGPNGSGKSTLLRLISGVIEPDCGTVQIDGMEVFENVKAKSNILFLGDDPYFFQQSTLEDMRNFYTKFYPNFDNTIYTSLIGVFKINPKEKINSFSKGMKRQCALIIALSCKPDILLLDEAFDGLDPVMRFKLRQIIADSVATQNIIAIISSHNLRELEDICDTVVMINNRTLALDHSSEEVHDLYHKYQVVFHEDTDINSIKSIKPLHVSGKSRIFSIIMKGPKDTCDQLIESLNPALFERTGVSLEEVFVYEVEDSNNA